jgi:LCP family protein required for cell wall assembly
MKQPDRLILLRSGLLLLAGAMLLLNVHPNSLSAAGATLPPTNTPRGTTSRPPTQTPTPPPATATPAARPSKTPTVIPTLVIEGTYQTPVQTPATAIPPMMPTPVASGDDVAIVGLFGSDTITPGAAARTDTIILLAVNRTRQTVTMMHIPRDLLVYVPDYTMVKINTVYNYGNVKYGDGGGAKLMKETLLYNLGIKLDFYARVDFVEFQKLIQKLGGLEISVDCGIQGYKLKDPKLPYYDESSWELYTLPVGHYKLDPYSALWYVRSRGSSSDFDRGRRQMDVLRAMWRQAKDAGLLMQVTQLWPEVQKLVETDMTLTDILGFVPTGLATDPSRIQRIDLALNVHFRAATIGAYVLLPNPDAMKIAMQNFVLPPPENRLGGEAPSIEIGAALPLKGIDQVAADMLSWQGFIANAIGAEGIANRDQTIIYDYTGNAKPNSRKAILTTLRVDPSAVVDRPDPARKVDFRIEMGHDYQKCLYTLPKETPDQ